MVALENELRDNKESTALAKNRYADWTQELQGKLKEMREDKKRMTAELSNAQAAESDLKVQRISVPHMSDV